MKNKRSNRLTWAKGFACCLFLTFSATSLAWGQGPGPDPAPMDVPAISGQVVYANGALTPLHQVTVELVTEGGYVMQSTQTDYNGNFSFFMQQGGNFLLQLSSSRPWGGGNSVDALLAMKHFVGLGMLTGLPLQAADVDASGFVNSVDALGIMKRFVGIENSFAAGDWVFETDTVMFNGTNSVTVLLKGMCYGDLDASFVPPPCTPMPTVANAGPDQLVQGTSTTLAGNPPQSGNGYWIILNGIGGTLTDPTGPASAFSGLAGNTYTLAWTVSTVCFISIDTVLITFDLPVGGLPCPGLPSFEHGGQTYTTVQIGDQCWMRENLNIGSMVAVDWTCYPALCDQTDNGLIEKFCYDNDPANCAIYGGLYKWDEMMQYTGTEGAQGICPDGWHLPTEAEWCQMITVLDPGADCNSFAISSLAGGSLKESGYDHWDFPNEGATNASGFTALGAGSFDTWGNFLDYKFFSVFWSSSQVDADNAKSYWINAFSAELSAGYINKAYGSSARCLKNAETPIMDVPCPDVPTFEHGGQTYNTVLIGNQCWMKENLNIGNMIDAGTGQSNNGNIEKYCYNNDPANCVLYGGLYQWDEMMAYYPVPGSQGLCPDGWRIPTTTQWCTLFTYLDPSVNCTATGASGTYAGGRMKETGFDYWYAPNSGATNESGFAARGGGFSNEGFFSSLKQQGYFWTSSQGILDYKLGHYLDSGNGHVYNYSLSATAAYSVRCIKGY